MKPVVADAKIRRSIIEGKLKVAPHEIAGELEKIRREAATADTAKNGPTSNSGSSAGPNGRVVAPKARVTLCNLIILVDQNTPLRVRDSIESLITELCVSYPSRFFIVECNGESGSVEETSENLETAVSSRCVQTNSGVHVCSEEVYIKTNTAAADLVPNLLLSLFVPDIDSALLVLTDPASSPSVGNRGLDILLQGIARVSSVVVYDSVLFADYLGSMQALLGQGLAGGDTHASGRLRPVDLTWKRVQRWRTLLAEQFDSAATQCESVGIRGLRVGCRVKAETFANGLVPSDTQLFVGWFLSALNWQPISWQVEKSQGSASILAQDGDGQECRVEFYAVEAEPGDDRMSTLRKIEVLVGLNGSAMRLMLTRKVIRGVAEVCTEASANGDAQTCEFFVRTAPFVSETFENIVISKIGNEGVDREYLLGLAMSRRVAELIQNSVTVQDSRTLR